MNDIFQKFEAVVRATVCSEGDATNAEAPTHPFEQRNIHPLVADVSLELFDDGHYSQATFEAFKRLDKEVAALSGLKNGSGYKLMMQALNEEKPLISLNPMSTSSHKDEQLGMKNIFAGAMSAIRNPRGHENLTDQIDVCLDHLSLASSLFRVLDGRSAP